MKTLALVLATALILGWSLSTMAAEQSPKAKLFHVVAFKFKEGTTKEQIKQVEDAFRDLKKKIREIKSYEWGTNISKENRNKGCTHGFILGFNSEKDRDTYINHPAHKEFGKLVGPVLDDVFVIDFQAKD
jgi:hypothetical protein